MKNCRICGIEKSLDDFRNRIESKDGKRNNCILCQDNHNKIYNEKNKIKISINRKKFYNENQERLLTVRKDYYYKNKEIIIKKQYQYDKLKKENDPVYRLKKNLRTMIGKSLTKKGYTKKSQTFLILGCLQNEFIKYIESKFEPWMSWENYGLYNGNTHYGWDIDHIIPLIVGVTEDEIIKLNHHTNLQPLCSFINRVKKRDNL